jgi:hypothetical protein
MAGVGDIAAAEGNHHLNRVIYQVHEKYSVFYLASFFAAPGKVLAGAALMRIVPAKSTALSTENVDNRNVVVIPR